MAPRVINGATRGVKVTTSLFAASACHQCRSAGMSESRSELEYSGWINEIFLELVDEDFL